MVIDESKNQNFLRLGYISLIEPSGQKHHRIVVGNFMLELAYPQNADVEASGPTPTSETPN